MKKFLQRLKVVGVVVLVVVNGGHSSVWWTCSRNLRVVIKVVGVRFDAG